MDRKQGSSYPVYLANDDYGMRGLNYRAPRNELGICMIICNAFPNTSLRIQGLMRVDRYNDNYYRIQNYLEIDINDE